jgi:hypothetical protein
LISEALKQRRAQASAKLGSGDMALVRSAVWLRAKQSQREVGESRETMSRKHRNVHPKPDRIAEPAATNFRAVAMITMDATALGIIFEPLEERILTITLKRRAARGILEAVASMTSTQRGILFRAIRSTCSTPAP